MIAHIIPCLNQYSITKNLLDSLYKHTHTSFLSEVIIVDNHSNDDTVHVFDEYNIDMYVRNNKANMGFSRAVNQGVLLSTSKLVCVWNNDMEVSPGWVQALLSPIKDGNYGMVTGTLIEPHEMALKSFRDLVRSETTDEVIAWAKGGPWLFNREVFDEVGYFDEQFFPAQYEDSDFLLRMALAGLKHGMVTGSKIYHHSALTQNSELMPKDKTYPQANRQRFIDKWGTAHIDYSNAYEKGDWHVV